MLTSGEYAAIIAAVAFVILVLFLIIFLVKAMGTVKRLNKNLEASEHAINLLAGDLDSIAEETEDLLSKTNDIAEDLNIKLEEVNPVFIAAGDVGERVNNISNSSKKFFNKFRR